MAGRVAMLSSRWGRSCPPAWCNWRWSTAFAGKSRAGQLAIAINPNSGSLGFLSTTDSATGLAEGYHYLVPLAAQPQTGTGTYGLNSKSTNSSLGSLIAGVVK